MKRLVYSPSVKAYVKTDMGIIDLSDYIVSGNVTRRVNQISSATLKLRNPNFRFTYDEVRKSKTGEIYPVMHPMDPIFITLSRYRDKEILVFTGYLDSSPYKALFPGTCEISASCTLKKLNLTWFDPALPYTIAYMSSKGWQPDFNGKLIKNFATTDKDGPKLNAESSFASLLFDTLIDIGNWDESQIYVQPLPDKILTVGEELYKQVRGLGQESLDEAKDVINTWVGSASYGGGKTINKSSGNSTTSTTQTGPVKTGGSIQGKENIIKTMCKIANEENVPAAMVIATAYVETDLTNEDTPGSQYHGWFQMSVPSCRYASGYTLEQTRDLAWATRTFCRGAKNTVPSSVSHSYPYLAWAMYTQGVNSSNNPRYPNTWDRYIKQAQSDISQYCGSRSSAQPRSTSANNENSTEITKSSRNSNDKKTANQAAAELAKELLASSNVKFPYSSPYGGTADKALRQVADGKCASVAFTGGCVGISLDMLNCLSYMAKRFPIYINAITTGEHSTGSDHYKGRAVDFDPQTGHESELDSIGAMFGGTSSGESYASNAHHHLSFRGGQNSSNGAPADFTNSNLSPDGGDSSDINDYAAASPQEVEEALKDIKTIARAAGVSAYLEGPTLDNVARALSLGGRKSLLNDKPLLPFIQELCTASLRSFMSLPNGNFFAFYPDYFGALGRVPYWEIQDIEILDGRIQLSDNALTTHVYVVGDTIGVSDGINIFDELASEGVITIFDAFNADFVSKNDFVRTTDSKGKPVKVKERGFNKAKDGKEFHLDDISAAKAFVQRYGIRPKYIPSPMIRNPFYELFSAYQQFQLLWSQQFITQFSFTFMPELYPGGLVALPNHGLSLYIEEVSHDFDYETGFVTQAQLSSPAGLDPNDPDRLRVSQGMIRPLGDFNNG